MHKCTQLQNDVKLFCRNIFEGFDHIDKHLQESPVTKAPPKEKKKVKKSKVSVYKILIIVFGSRYSIRCNAIFVNSELLHQKPSSLIRFPPVVFPSFVPMLSALRMRLFCPLEALSAESAS